MTIDKSRFYTVLQSAVNGDILLHLVRVRHVENAHIMVAYLYTYRRITFSVVTFVNVTFVFHSHSNMQR